MENEDKDFLSKADLLYSAFRNEGDKQVSEGWCNSQLHARVWWGNPANTRDHNLLKGLIPTTGKILHKFCEADFVERTGGLYRRTPKIFDYDSYTDFVRKSTEAANESQVFKPIYMNKIQLEALKEQVKNCEMIRLFMKKTEQTKQGREELFYAYERFVREVGTMAQNLGISRLKYDVYETAIDALKQHGFLTVLENAGTRNEMLNFTPLAHHITFEKYVDTLEEELNKGSAKNSPQSVVNNNQFHAPVGNVTNTGDIHTQTQNIGNADESKKKRKKGRIVKNTVLSQGQPKKEE